MTSNQEKYRLICRNETSIPIFSRDWWLDSVAENQWDVALAERNGMIVAALPYVKKENKIIMPKHTQTMGIWAAYPPKQKNSTRLGYEKDIFNELIDQLPTVDHFFQRFHYSVTNWLPFYWRGYQQTTRYTYVLDQLEDLNRVFNEFRSNIKTDIRKAVRSVDIKIEDDIEKFYTVNQKTFERQNVPMGYTLDYVKKIDRACRERNCRKMWFAYDQDNRIHAAIYVIWDENSAYYIMGGGDPELRNSGATSLLLWEAIKHSATVTAKFDFEGSMLEPVERFFRAFGAKQTPYFLITKGEAN
ncbi:Acetyltransferase (GNAT) domain-containing protein [Cohnella sp. OV330]|uniref:GNAT family N-acetyltransferase n=1 Tax=Cohnella sp. OV330 TaxID=1855288 RepID=UPI0008E7477A|nr:GNAT family N-acetyltransferase [Cohnella sp. OV330]SFB47905.1 Acetyltransferase (GNAT) domain-containing protein [Cohnella sp. OV330]